MNIHLDLNTLIAVGVGAHLIGALVKTFVKEPRKQAQIDAVEAKIDAALAQVRNLAGAVNFTPKGPTQ